LFSDAWGVDAMYSGSQKCLSGPPGGAPIMLGPRALHKMQNRKTVPATYNLDLNMVRGKGVGGWAGGAAEGQLLGHKSQSRKTVPATCNLDLNMGMEGCAVAPHGSTKDR
jgi:hypothetical protein